MSEPDTGRRATLLGLVALLVCRNRAACAAAQDGERHLELTSLHTGEVLQITFQNAQGIDSETTARLRHALRDYRSNEEHALDPELFVLLSDVAERAQCAPRFEVISAYRSPATNGMLHATGHHVAEHSLHMQGRAIDVRLRGCPLERLYELALAAQRGGVGFYPRSNFVHVDTGRVRTWRE